MCGLVGVAGNITLTHKKALKNLLLFDTTRGEHSTGLLSVFKAKKKKSFFLLLKAVGSPEKLYEKHPEFFDKGVYDHKDNPFLLMGHNRWATQGAIDEEGAHPFLFDNLIGAHNGTVRQWSLKDFHGAKKFDIDSQIIFSELSHSGDIKKVWGELDGAASLTWYNRKNGTMNFLRNDERPMQICFTPDRRTMFWASEAWMLTIALAKAGIKHLDIVSTEEDMHYEFTIKDGVPIAHKEEEYEPRKPFVYSYGQNYQQKFWPIECTSHMKEGEDSIRVKLIEMKYVDGIRFFSAEFYFVTNPEEKFPVRIKYQYINRPEEGLKRKIEDSIKKGGIYFYTKFRHVCHIDKIDSLWYDSLYLDDVQTESGVEEKKEVGKEPKKKFNNKVEKLWRSPENELIWQAKFEEQYFFCENCHSNIFWEDRTRIKVISKESCLCEECSNLPFLSHYMT